MLPVEQFIRLHKGDNTIFCAVWDISNHRLGTLEIAVKVDKSALIQP